MKSDHAVKIFSLAVLLSIIFSGFFIKSYLHDNSESLNVKIKSIQQSIGQKNWSSAKNTLEKLSYEWEKSEATWALFINHHEIDNITISLLKSSEYIKNSDTSNSLSHLSELKEYIDHIPSMESISFKNIF